MSSWQIQNFRYEQQIDGLPVELIEAAREACMSPQMFRDSYAGVETGGADWQALDAAAGAPARPGRGAASPGGAARRGGRHSRGRDTALSLR